MAEHLREQHAFYYNEAQRIPRRSTATREDLEDRRSGSPLPTRTRNTADDDDIVEDVPSRFPSSARRYNVPVVPREYLIPLANGKALYVTEQKLATLGRNYQQAAREVLPGTIPQKQQQRRRPRPNQNKAQPPDVIYGQPAYQRDTHEESEPPSYPPTLGEQVKALLARALVVLGIGLLIMMVGYVLFNILGTWWTTQHNDWMYGRPRTFQIDWNVGHGTASNPDSHFIAQNLNRKIVVIEIPGNDPSRSQIYLGPQLYGPGQELTPVTVSFEDVNHDGHPDLVIHVADSTFIFLNQQVNGTWKFVPAPTQQ